MHAHTRGFIWEQYSVSLYRLISGFPLLLSHKTPHRGPRGSTALSESSVPPSYQPSSAPLPFRIGIFMSHRPCVSWVDVVRYTTILTLCDSTVGSLCPVWLSVGERCCGGHPAPDVAGGERSTGQGDRADRCTLRERASKVKGFHTRTYPGPHTAHSRLLTHNIQHTHTHIQTTCVKPHALLCGWCFTVSRWTAEAPALRPSLPVDPTLLWLIIGGSAPASNPPANIPPNVKTNMRAVIMMTISSKCLLYVMILFVFLLQPIS